MSDYSKQYNTPLNKTDLGLYEKWFNSLPSHQRNTIDYDMQGVFASGIRGKNGHFPDTYKKPNHPTFSMESKYSGVDGHTGGEWRNILGVEVFVPSRTNFTQNKPSFLREYFKQVEPNSLLLYDLKDILEAFPQFKEDKHR